MPEIYTKKSRSPWFSRLVLAANNCIKLYDSSFFFCNPISTTLPLLSLKLQQYLPRYNKQKTNKKKNLQRTSRKRYLRILLKLSFWVVNLMLHTMNRYLCIVWYTMNKNMPHRKKKNIFLVCFNKTHLLLEKLIGMYHWIQRVRIKKIIYSF